MQKKVFTLIELLMVNACHLRHSSVSAPGRAREGFEGEKAAHPRSRRATELGARQNKRGVRGRESGS